MKLLSVLSMILADSTYFGGLLSSEDLGLVGGILSLYIIGLVLGLAYIFFVRIYIAYLLAKNRHREPLIWVLLSCFVSPLLAWIILVCIGDKNEKSKANEIVNNLEQKLNDV